MKILQRLILVQFFLYDMEEFQIGGHVAFLGLNGSGKTSILDAIQIAMMGAHGNYIAFNTQSVGSTGSGRRNPRSIRDYCLGVVDNSGESSGQADRKRDSALSYITLVFEDDKTQEPVSIGICLRADAKEAGHEVLGMYVLPGTGLTLADHIESEGDGSVPLLWNDFEAAMRSRFGKMKRTPFFTDQPMAYIKEMLHALQPKTRAVNERDYLKVFNKSILLRNIESVDTFVRDYVVEPQSIDRRRARTQIEHFKELNELLEKVKGQIMDLDEIKRKYGDVQKLAMRAASLKALEARMTADERRREWEQAEDQLDRLFRSRRVEKHGIKNVKAQADDAREEYESAQEALSNTPGIGELKSNMELKSSHEKSFAIASRRIEADLVNITGVIEDIGNLKDKTTLSRDIKRVKQELAHHRNRFEQGHVTGLDTPILSAIDLFRVCGPVLETAEMEATEAKKAADSLLTSLMGQVRNADRNGAPISKEIGRIIEHLSQHGIEAEPICNLVQITDPSWQPAIESYLKTNRESLMVTAGKEREAIALIRKMPERDNPYVARVIQPYHLRDHHWDTTNKQLVGNLFASDNPIALAYLRSLFGNMRCVQTEEELEKNTRSITLDGMLSANFTTSRLRIFTTTQLLFGKRLTHAEKEAIQTGVRQASEDSQKAGALCDLIAKAKSSLQRLGDLDEVRARVADNVTQAIESQADIFNVEKVINAIDAGNFMSLRKEVSDNKEKWEALTNDLRQRDIKLAEVVSTLRKAVPDRWKARRQYNEAAVWRDMALEGDVDPAVMNDVERLIDSDGYHQFSDRISSCQRRHNLALSEAETAKSAAFRPLQQYLDKHGISQGDTLLHWQNAQAWVSSEYQRLTDTELAQREDDVQLARAAAEEAFRSDVAVRMRESIIQMRSTIDAINKTLAVCPSFSNGERYRFSVKPAEAHSAIYKYIMDAGNKTDSDFFSLGDQAHLAIMNLLDDANSDKSENPLDDYRTLFCFDLIISREGRKDTVLSKRLGVGSNGEHRAPFYVIAGAAMAAAYRLDDGKQSNGAGLMLLDEAFYGMDQQNSLAAARFLDSIGLQMIIGAPESDHSKLAPMLDTIFELNRFEMDVFIGATKVKEPAHRLLTSDMPSEHPDLITMMVDQIKNEAVVA